MSERHIIEERLKKKESEIQGLEEKLRSARVYAQALQDVLKLLGGKPDEALLSEPGLRPGSSVDRAREAILQNGKPLHINDLLETLGLETTREGRASLTSSLSAYVRRNEIFTRPAPSTFGLVELGHHQEDMDPDEPPKGFGKPSSHIQTTNDLDDDIPF